jgi:AmmeMemoRadiSam system protein A
MLDPILLKIAKTAILQKFDSSYSIDKEALIQSYPFLAKKGASFVTLNKSKNLRGCIGSIIAHRSLLDDIIHNAKLAAFKDPRFQPLKADETNQLTLEVSVLTAPKKLEYSDFEDLKSKITPKKDGLILKLGQYQGTFLPQVWEQLPDTKEFLEHLSYKAGANPTIYEYHPEIYIYRVEHIEDNWDAILPL